MSGNEMVILAVLLLVIFITLSTVVALTILMSRQSATVLSHQKELVDLITKQNALIASSDALTYQAVRAADVFSSYDGASDPALTEEDEDGDGSDGLGEHFESGDPFLDGKLFTNN